MKLRSLIAGLAAAAAVLPVLAFAQDRVGTGFSNRRPDGPRQANYIDEFAFTPEGGVRIGNPNARIKIVEYLSLTCPHCAQFAHESEALFDDHVRRGAVSVEYRNYFLNGADVAAALLTRCASPRAYFNLTHQLLGSQPQWMGRMNAITPAQRAELGTMQPLQVAQRLIVLLGLDRIGERHGISAADRQRCLTQANLDRLQQLRQTGDQAGVQGTPTFFINGQIQSANTWAGIQPLLRQ